MSKSLNIIAIAFLSFFPLKVNGQVQPSFAKSLPSTCFITSVIPSDNNYLAIGGCSEESHLLRPFAAKLNPLGKVIWRKEFRFRGSYWGNFEFGIQTKSGHYILSGRRNTTDPLQTDPFIMKIGSSGNVVWKKGDFRVRQATTLTQRLKLLMEALVLPAEVNLTPRVLF